MAFLSLLAFAFLEKASVYDQTVKFMRKFPPASPRNPQRVEVFDTTEQEIIWIITIKTEDGLHWKCVISVVKGEGLPGPRRCTFPYSCVPSTLHIAGIWAGHYLFTASYLCSHRGLQSVPLCPQT